MTVPPDELPSRLQKLAEALLVRWQDPLEDDHTPAELRLAVARVHAALAGLESDTPSALQHLVDLLPLGRMPTGDQPVPIGALLAGLYSAARQHLRGSAAKEVLRLCDEIRIVEGERRVTDEPATEFLAALMVIEDATCAMQGYRALPGFAHVDEAYLAKYGLLQAAQLGFDAVQALGRSVGVSLRADGAGGKSVKIVRNIVAGHPIGGNMNGQPWHHFQDRASAHDKNFIRVMSFSRQQQGRWTGQTLRTNELIDDTLAVLAALLQSVAAKLREPSES